MEKLINIINDQYKLKNNYTLNDKGIIKSCIFLPQIKKLTKTKYTDTNILLNVLKSKESYNAIKNIILEFLIIDRKIINNIFVDLEKLGFSNFDKTNQSDSIIEYINKINAKYDNYGTQFNKIKGPIFGTSDCLINKSILLMIEYFNSCTFMPQDIFINLDPTYNSIRILNISGDTVIKNLYILTNTKDNIIDNIFLQKIIKIVNITVNTLKILLNSKSSIEFDLTLYIGKSLKKFPTKLKQTISETNVNSGDTTYQSSNLYRPFVRIYRYEELFKVIIHETIHCTNFDDAYAIMPPKHNFNLFNTKYNNSSLLFGETITETLAEFINCIIYSNIYKAKYSEILNKELEHGITQVAKILKYFGFKSVKDFLTSNNNTIKQKTAMFEYHILKTILFYEFDNFIKLFINKSNSNTIFNLIQKIISSIEFQNKVDSAINNITEYLGTSFRMSIIDINSQQLGGKYKKRYKIVNN